MKELPTGVLTFLFTDVVSSTQLWERSPLAMSKAMALHDEILMREIASAGGTVVRLKGEGDSFFAVFTRATDSVVAACAVQRSLVKTRWPEATPIVVRIAMHTGESELRDGDYYGSAPNRCARLRGIAHGGQVLISGTTQALVRDALPPGVNLLDLGEHRLRDMTRPEHVYQLEHPDLRRDFPPLKSVDLQSINLPLHLAGFVGRHRELAEVKSSLVASRLVTLTGPGGSGKSRIAQHAAGELLDRFPDGVWWVDMAQLTDAGHVPEAVAAPLGIREQSGRPLVDSLVEELASKTALILLDNCEHLVAACADVATRILSAAASIRLLVTSREALGIRGERVLPVLELADDEALQLFAERAQLNNPRFQLTDQNRDVVTRICRKLDGIPLAIELASARTKLMSVDQLYHRLDHRFAVLGAGLRGTQARQQTLRATVDWSYELLETDEKIAFDMLAVCVGGFSLEAADAICAAGTDALNVVSRLVDKSMIVAGETTQGEPRYRILETLREYALERLAGTEHEPPARARHLDYFVGLAEKNNAAGDRSRMAATFEVELGNFLAAMEACETAPPGVGVRLAIALAPCWPMRGHVSMGRAWSEHMVGRAGPDQPRLAWAYHELGWLALYGGDLEAATSHFERSERLARAAGDLTLAGRALNALAGADISQGNLESGRLRCEQALKDLEAVGDASGQAQAHHYLGWAAFFAGEYSLAYQHVEQTLELRELEGEPNDLSVALANVAWVAAKLGRFDEARARFLQAFQLQLSIVNQVIVAVAIHDAAFLAAEMGELRQAMVMTGAGHSLKGGLAIMGHSPYMQWLMSWEAVVREKLGETESDAAYAEGARLTPIEAIQMSIEWLNGVEVAAREQPHEGGR